MVYRIKEPDLNLGQYATPTLTKQSCNTNESGGSGSLCAAGASVQAHLKTLTTLIQDWLTQYTTQTYLEESASAPAASSGFSCIIDGKGCEGPTLDNNAYRSYDFGELTSSGPVFVIGVLHSASAADTTTTIPTNNATYTGVSLADDTNSENEGLADQAQSNLSATGFASQKLLQGSATEILSDLKMSLTDAGFIDDLPNLYVVVFNQGGSCIFPFGCDSTKHPYIVNLSNLPSGDIGKVTERGYLLPQAAGGSNPLSALQVGANPDYLISPNILCDAAGTIVGQGEAPTNCQSTANDSVLSTRSRRTVVLGVRK